MPDPPCLALSPCLPPQALSHCGGQGPLFLRRAPDCGTSLAEEALRGSGAWAWELRCSGLRPGADCVLHLGSSVPCGPRILSFLPTGGVAGVAWVAAGQQCSSLRPLRARQPHCLRRLQSLAHGILVCWCGRNIPFFSFPNIWQVLTVHLQIGPGSMQRPSELRVWLGLEAPGLSAAPRHQSFLDMAVLPVASRSSHLLLGPSELAVYVRSRSGRLRL